MGNATLQLPPAAPMVPADLSGGPRGGAVIRWAAGINAALRGSISATVKLTLAPSDTTSNLYDTRIGIWSFIGLMPLTANAAAALPSIWVQLHDGMATLNHASSPHTDQTYLACIIGR